MPKTYAVCTAKKCCGWQWDTKLAAEPWCPKCWKPMKPSGKGKGKGKADAEDSTVGKDKGIEQLLEGLKALNVAESPAAIALIAQAAAQQAKEPQAPRHVRVAQAANEYKNAMRDYEDALARKQKALKHYQDMQERLDECGKRVVEAEDKMMAVQSEGKGDKDKGKGVLQQLMDTDVATLAQEELKALEEAYEEGADFDEETRIELRAATSEAKKQLLNYFKSGASSFKDQFDERIKTERDKALAKQKEIVQAAKKRKADSGAAVQETATSASQAVSSDAGGPTSAAKEQKPDEHLAEIRKKMQEKTAAVPAPAGGAPVAP